MEASSALGNTDPDPAVLLSSETQHRLTSRAHTKGGSPRASDAVTAAITFLSKSGVGEGDTDTSIVSSLVDIILLPLGNCKLRVVELVAYALI